LAIALCHDSEPQLLEHRPGRFSACHRVDAIPELAATMRKGPKLSDLAKDPDKLIAQVGSALKADETEGAAVQQEID
jgi:hypothetical protein